MVELIKVIGLVAFPGVLFITWFLELVLLKKQFLQQAKKKLMMLDRCHLLKLIVDQTTLEKVWPLKKFQEQCIL
jgi:hypothetical protein